VRSLKSESDLSLLQLFPTTAVTRSTGVARRRMQQEDELDFDEDELVPQPALVSSSSHSSISSSQPPPLDSSTVPAPTANVPSSSTNATAHDPTVDVTGKKLPAGWISRISNSTGETYYRNTVNNTSSWEIPTSSAVPPEEESAAPTAQAPPVQASPELQANPQTQAQQGTVTADATEERIEKPLPTGPRSQTRTPQSAGQFWFRRFSSFFVCQQHLPSLALKRSGISCTTYWSSGVKAEWYNRYSTFRQTQFTGLRFSRHL